MTPIRCFYIYVIDFLDLPSQFRVNLQLSVSQVINNNSLNKFRLFQHKTVSPPLRAMKKTQLTLAIARAKGSIIWGLLICFLIWGITPPLDKWMFTPNIKRYTFKQNWIYAPWPFTSWSYVLRVPRSGENKRFLSFLRRKPIGFSLCLLAKCKLIWELSLRIIIKLQLMRISVQFSSINDQMVRDSH